MGTWIPPSALKLSRRVLYWQYLCHCERSEAIQELFSGLPREYPRNDPSSRTCWFATGQEDINSHYYLLIRIVPAYRRQARLLMETTDLIKEKIDVADFIKQYVALIPAGKNLKGLCPFHKEKTPSFIVSPDRQMWHCFGCQNGGDVITFLMKFENIEFI